MRNTPYQTATRIVLIANALVLTAILGGCGGADTTPNVGLTYTGVVTQSVITQSNGEEIVQNAYQAGANGNTLGNSAGNIPTSIQTGTQTTPRGLQRCTATFIPNWPTFSTLCPMAFQRPIPGSRTRSRSDSGRKSAHE